MEVTEITESAEGRGDKRKRGPNLSTTDKDIILDLVLKYQFILENKKTDAINVKQKEDAWKKIEIEFNSISQVKRDWYQIRQAYENFKRKTKKDAAQDKIERYKTGGGTFLKKVDSAGEKLLAILGNRAEPLPNQYDSDASYNNHLDTLQKDGNGVNGNDNNTKSLPSAQQFYIEIVKELPTAQSGSAVEAMSVCSSSLKAPSTFSQTAAPLQTVAHSEPGPSSSGSRPSSGTHSPEASSSSTSQWAGRRRPSLQKRAKISGIRAEATAKITDLAEVKATYYREKLEMDKKEHEMCMRILVLKEELYNKQVQKY